MKQLRDQDVNTTKLITLSDQLRRLETSALHLQTLAQRSGFLIMAASLGISQPRTRFVELRRLSNDMSGLLSDLRHAETEIVPQLSPSARGQISAVLSPQAMETYVQLLGMVRDLTADLQAAPHNVELGRAELFRYVTTEVQTAIDGLLSAVRGGLLELSVDENKLAYIDDLTGLPNRRALYQLADRLWNANGPGKSMSVMRLDIDNFKPINDAFGHATGDFTLRRAANILRQQLRVEDFVARVSGDEFIFILCGEAVANTVAAVAQQIIDKISTPFEFDDQTVCSTISAGIVTVVAGDNQTLDRLLHNADLALYSAKTNGRAQYQFYTPELRTRHETNETIVSEITDGLARGEFVPYFQPQVNGRTGELVGFEALARWLHPERGILTPYHFLDVATRAGLLDELDWQVTVATVTALKTWRDSGLTVPQVSINITPDRLVRPTLPQDLVKLVSDMGVPVNSIGLEILESAMIESGSVEMIRTIRQLSSAGFVVELDDFGTGHASIANLRHFKVDRIKIDRSFVKDIHLHMELSKITSAIIGLAHSLRIDALAEGVETPEERLILNALGIDHIQGFGVARPMPQSQVSSWIKRTQAQPVLPPRRSSAP